MGFNIWVSLSIGFLDVVKLKHSFPEARISEDYYSRYNMMVLMEFPDGTHVVIKDPKREEIYDIDFDCNGISHAVLYIYIFTFMGLEIPNIRFSKLKCRWWRRDKRLTEKEAAVWETKSQIITRVRNTLSSASHAIDDNLLEKAISKVIR
jgi:hypothetical protein